MSKEIVDTLEFLIGTKPMHDFLAKADTAMKLWSGIGMYAHRCVWNPVEHNGKKWWGRKNEIHL